VKFLAIESTDMISPESIPLRAQTPIWSSTPVALNFTARKYTFEKSADLTAKPKTGNIPTPFSSPEAISANTAEGTEMHSTFGSVSLVVVMASEVESTGTTFGTSEEQLKTNALNAPSKRHFTYRIRTILLFRYRMTESWIR
jgi:hypothetical protein